MPLYRFRCDCGWEAEELFRRHCDAEGTDVPAALVCGSCGSKASRAMSNRFSHPSDISNMERYESALLTSDQRAAGARFKSMKDVDLFEETAGLERIEPGTTKWKNAWSDQMDDHRTIQSRGEAEVRAGGDGVSVAADYVDQSEIQQATGWDKTTYDKWKERSDAAQDLADHGGDLAAG